MGAPPAPTCHSWTISPRALLRRRPKPPRQRRPCSRSSSPGRAPTACASAQDPCVSQNQGTTRK
eukprot:3061692-Pyramimonas_sp.AAC.1